MVVGNPCNTNALICMANAPTLDKRNFHALTRLDEQSQVSVGVEIRSVLRNRLERDDLGQPLHDASAGLCERENRWRKMHGRDRRPRLVGERFHAGDSNERRFAD